MTSLDNDQPACELDHAIRRGTRAVVAGQLVSQLISLLVLAVLYRLVTPDQFGLLGMVVPLLLLARIFATFGLSVATVQRQHLTDGQLAIVFWFGVALSVVLALLAAACGPVLAWLYEAPPLKPLCAALAGTLIIASLGAQHQALLERKLRIGRLTAARVAAQAIGGAAGIGAAAAGWGVWSLVVQQYIELLVLTAAAWRLDPWRPGFVYRGERAGDLLRFGGFYSLSSLMFFAGQNADKFLLALCLGSTRQGQAALGMYSQAFNLMMKPVYLVSSPVTGIMLPALSRVARDGEQFERQVVKFYRMVGVALFPAAVGVALVAQDIMAVLGGDAWRQAGTMLAALAPTILVQGFVNIAGSVFASAGRAGRLLAGATASAVLLAAGSLIGFWLGGRFAAAPWGPTMGVACGYSIATVVVLFVPYMLFCFATVRVSARAVFRPLCGPAVAAALMGLLVAALSRAPVMDTIPAVARLIVLAAVGALAYAWLARRQLGWLGEQLAVFRRERSGE